MIRKNDICKILAFVTVSSMTVSLFKYADVGASDDISLQSPVSSLEPVVVYEPEDIPVVYMPDEEKSNLRKDSVNIESNTLVVTADVDSSVELLDESTFTYDGTQCWVNANLANLRESPDVDSETVAQVEYATPLLRISYGTLWSKVRLEDGTEGFMLSSLLDTDEIEAPTPTPSPEPTATPTPEPTQAPSTTSSSSVSSSTETTSATEAQTEAAPSYTETDYEAHLYASCDLNVRTGPGTSYSFVTVLTPGEGIDVVARTDNGWYRTSSGYYVKADLCSEEAPAPAAPAASEDSSSSSESSSSSSASYSSAGDCSDFASYCTQFVGIPYVYGGASTSGFDCSGFVSYVYANYYGVSLPHDAAGIAECGTAVSMDNLQCGDVICHDYNNDGYIEHVSIYIGNGTYIHASDSRHGVITTSYAGGIATVRRFV